MCLPGVNRRAGPTTRLPSSSQNRSQHTPPPGRSPAPRNSRGGSAGVCGQQRLASWGRPPRAAHACETHSRARNPRQPCSQEQGGGDRLSHRSPVPEGKGVDRLPSLVGRSGAPHDPPRGTERGAEERSKLEARRTERVKLQKKGLLLGDTNAAGPWVRSQGGATRSPEASAPDSTGI